MSTEAAPIPAGLPIAAPAPKTSCALLTGLIGIGLTAVGAVVCGVPVVAFSWLVGIMFWTAIAIGALLFHHDPARLRCRLGCGHPPPIRTRHRRLQVAGLALRSATAGACDFLSKARALAVDGSHPHRRGPRRRERCRLPQKGSVPEPAVVCRLFGAFLWHLDLAVRPLAAGLVLPQDDDGDIHWTHKNRFTSAVGIPLTALSLTFAAIFWMKSLEYHWFSTMYGVYYFADCMRGALASGVLIMLWLYRLGDYKGILNTNHLHSIGMLMLTFTVFWGYIGFSQYFLIWNANVPEETFWFNEREIGQWWYVGMALVFLYFLFSFLYLLSYRNKIVHQRIKFIACWNLTFLFVDLCFNVLPAFKGANGDPRPFLSSTLLWSITSILGIGGVCVWAYLKSFPTTKLIPIRDPRIGESLTYHEPSA